MTQTPVTKSTYENSKTDCFKATEHPGSSSFFKPVIQAKFTINQPNDPYEQEADAVSDKVMRMKAPLLSPQRGEETFFKPRDSSLSFGEGWGEAIQKKCEHCEEEEEKKKMQRKGGDHQATEASSETENYLSSLSGGEGLSNNERSFFEPRIGYDFSNVRIHNDSSAHQSAKNINALAYTHGNNIVFGNDQYHPDTTAGKNLLAHELTHVVQQDKNSSIMRKTAAKQKAPPYVAEAMKMVADEEKKIIKFVSSRMEPESLPVTKKYLEFTQAVATGDKLLIQKLLAELLKSGTGELPQFYPTRSSIGQIIAILVQLDLVAEANTLQEWFVRQQIQDSELQKGYSLEIFLWQSIMDNLPDTTKIKDADAADKITDQLLKTLRYIEPTLSKLFKQYEKQPKPFRSTPVDPLAPKDYDLAYYIKELSDDMVSIFTKFQVAYQLIFDKAAEDLGAAKGDKYLQTAKAKIGALSQIQMPLASQLEVTKTIATEKRGKITGGKVIDYFLDKDKAQKKSVAINFYSPESPYFISEQEMNLGHIITVRQMQVRVMERLYGLERDTKGASTAETLENAAAIKQAGKLRLHSNEDWRKFLFEKFEAAKTGKGKVKAFDAVLELIKIYLDAFTTHTPYNIDDFGDNQLSINFPRAMSGQLIHDCGVYALRVTFMLSLLRNHPDLDLKIRFVRMPVHVGLVITGDGLPAYFVNNNQVDKIDKTEIDRLYKEWQEKSAKEGIPVPAGTAGKERFLEEVEAAKYIGNVGMPYRSFDAPVLKGDDKKGVAALWKFYQKNINPEIFDPGIKNAESKYYSFQMKYLEVLQAFKTFYNYEFVPFWNNVIVKWKKDLTKAYNEPGNKENFKKLFKQYEALVNAKFDKWQEEFKKIDTLKTEIDQFLKENPGVMDKNTFTNLNRAIDFPWHEEMKGRVLDADFSHPDDPRNKTIEPVDM